MFGQSRFVCVCVLYCCMLCMFGLFMLSFCIVCNFGFYVSEVFMFSIVCIVCKVL